MPEETDPLIVLELEQAYGVPITLRAEFKPKQEPPQEPEPAVAITLPALLQAAQNSTFTNIAGIIPAPAISVTTNLGMNSTRWMDVAAIFNPFNFKP